MLRSIKHLRGDKLGATDGEIGQVEDFYFDDRHWAIRYLVVDTGSWLAGRSVLISPQAIRTVYQPGKILIVKLTRSQIEGSPSADLHKPVSRLYEEEYYRYYGWPTYWDGDLAWGGSEFPGIGGDKAVPKTTGTSAQPGPHHSEANLRSAKVVTGYQIQAGDDVVGHLDDFLVDDTTWMIRQLVVNTGTRFAGHKVVVSPGIIECISWDESKIHVKATKDEILGAPPYRENRATAGVADA